MSAAPVACTRPPVGAASCTSATAHRAGLRRPREGFIRSLRGVHRARHHTHSHHAPPPPTPATNCHPISADERADVRKKSLLTHRLGINTDYNSLIPHRPAFAPREVCSYRIASRPPCLHPAGTTRRGRSCPAWASLRPAASSNARRALALPRHDACAPSPHANTLDDVQLCVIFSRPVHTCTARCGDLNI